MAATGVAGAHLDPRCRRARAVVHLDDDPRDRAVRLELEIRNPLMHPVGRLDSSAAGRPHDRAVAAGSQVLNEHVRTRGLAGAAARAVRIGGEAVHDAEGPVPILTGEARLSQPELLALTVGAGVVVTALLEDPARAALVNGRRTRRGTTTRINGPCARSDDGDRARNADAERDEDQLHARSNTAKASDDRRRCGYVIHGRRRC